MDRASKRLQKQEERDQRINALHLQYPELKAIDEAMAANGRAMLAATVEPGSKQRLAMLERQHMEILLEQQQFLEKVGLDTSIYEEQWDCPLCQDRGYIYPGQKCSCVRQEAVAARREHSGLAALQLLQTFENFSLEWYSNPQHYAVIKQAAEAFALQVCLGQRGESLLFYGEVGTGKTHLCSAIANKVLAEGRSVIYMKSGRLFNWLRNQMFAEQEKNEDPIETLCQVDLLIIDDLGSEVRTDFVEEQLYNLIDERIIRQKPWVISTNDSIEELCRRYDERITDRIIGEANRYRFAEKSIRCQKKQ